jgi:hypothetical protein
MFYYVDKDYIDLPENAKKGDTALDVYGNKYKHNGKEWVDDGKIDDYTKKTTKANGRHVSTTPTLKEWWF